MRHDRRMVCLVLLGLIVGCGQRRSQPVTPTKPTPELKTLLNQISETGTLEDLEEAVSLHIEKITERDEAQGRELAHDFVELQRASSAAAVKAQAQKMAGKLP